MEWAHKIGAYSNGVLIFFKSIQLNSWSSSPTFRSVFILLYYELHNTNLSVLFDLSGLEFAILTCLRGLLSL